MISNEERYRYKKETGITIIALVITIVILLILATVTINSLTKPDGMLDIVEDQSSKATYIQAKQEADIAIEKIKLTEDISSYDDFLVNLKEKLKEQDINVTVEKKEIGEEKAYVVTYKGVTLDDYYYDYRIVTFDANGVEGTITQSKLYGQKLGKLPMIKREGYKFLGWFTEKNEGTQITEDTIMLINDVTYYAHWEENK